MLSIYLAARTISEAMLRELCRAGSEALTIMVYTAVIRGLVSNNLIVYTIVQQRTSTFTMAVQQL